MWFTLQINVQSQQDISVSQTSKWCWDYTFIFTVIFLITYASRGLQGPPRTCEGLQGPPRDFKGLKGPPRASRSSIKGLQGLLGTFRDLQGCWDYTFIFTVIFLITYASRGLQGPLRASEGLWGPPRDFKGLQGPPEAYRRPWGPPEAL